MAKHFTLQDLQYLINRAHYGRTTLAPDKTLIDLKLVSTLNGKEVYKLTKKGEKLILNIRKSILALIYTKAPLFIS